MPPSSCSPEAIFWFRLERVAVGLAGANAHCLLNRYDKDLAVADLAGLGGGADRLDHAVGVLLGDGDLDADFRQKIHGVFGAAIDFGVALLPAVALDLGHRHAVDADA